MNRRTSNSKENNKPRLNIYLQIPNKQIHLKAPIPCPMTTLVELLMKALPSLASKIAYFQTVDFNWPLDYKIQNKAGQLKNDCTIRCVLQKKTKETYPGVSEYSILKCVGVGGFSKVYLVRSKLDGSFYVAKYIAKKNIEDKIQLIINEKTVNEYLDFPFLVKMRQFIQIQQFYVMILDYCPGGELFHLQRQVLRFDEQSAKKYFIQVLLAIEYMHSKQIIYRDLKPQNIMLDMEGHIRITDFGLAKVSKEKRYSYCGSLEYMSPEVLSRKGYSFQVDYYCLGALLYEMVIGCPPFYESGSPQNQTKFRIMHEQIYFPEDVDLSQNLKNFLQLLLQKDPKKRLGHLAGVKEIKCHPWIGWINLSDYLTKKVPMPHPVDLDRFNFDSKDITDSANRLLYDIKQKQTHQKRPNRLSHTSQTKRKESPYRSPYRQGKHKILQHYTSQAGYQTKSFSRLKNRRKQESLDLKIARKINSAKSHPKHFNNFQSVKCLYLSNSHHPINLSNFFRHTTEGNQINKSRQNDRKSYVKQQTQCKQNERKGREGLKKRRAKQQYLFLQIKRI